MISFRCSQDILTELVCSTPLFRLVPAGVILWLKGADLSSLISWLLFLSHGSKRRDRKQRPAQNKQGQREMPGLPPQDAQVKRVGRVGQI